MIKKNSIKVLAISLCMSALFTGVAYANSISPAYTETASVEKAALYDMQKKLDQYLFVDKVNEIEEMGFEVVYTGVSADEYIEVGITPYSEENAEFIYREFGKEEVKVVAADEVVLYAPDELIRENLPMDSGNAWSPVMDIGDDTAVSDTDYNDYADNKLISEREKLASEDDGEDLSEELADLISQTGIVEDLPIEDIEEDNLDVIDDAGYITSQEDIVKTVSDNTENDTDSEKGSIITARNIAIAIGAIVVIGGTAFLSSKQKAMKGNK